MSTMDSEEFYRRAVLIAFEAILGNEMHEPDNFGTPESMAEEAVKLATALMNADRRLRSVPATIPVLGGGRPPPPDVPISAPGERQG